MDPLGRSQGCEPGVWRCLSAGSLQLGVGTSKAKPERLPWEVVYVGITNNLNTRPASDHAGVKKYLDQIHAMDDRLFVTFTQLFETGCADYAQQRIYAEYVEALLVWRFTQQHGHPPVLHYGQKGKHADQVAALIKTLQEGRSPSTALATGVPKIS